MGGGGKAGKLFNSGLYQAWILIQVDSWPGAWPACLSIYSAEASTRAEGRMVLTCLIRIAQKFPTSLFFFQPKAVQAAWEWTLVRE